MGLDDLHGGAPAGGVASDHGEEFEEGDGPLRRGPVVCQGGDRLLEDSEFRGPRWAGPAALPGNRRVVAIEEGSDLEELVAGFQEISLDDLIWRQLGPRGGGGAQPGWDARGIFAT
jgi:hypothetical protein